MLILTRKSRETIMVGDDIKITILGMRGGYVRVGINAPKALPIHREEVYKRIQSKLATQNQHMEEHDYEKETDPE